MWPLCPLRCAQSARTLDQYFWLLRWMKRLKDSLEFNVQKRESWKHRLDSSIIQVGNNMCFLSNWSSWFIFMSPSKCKAECARVLVCVCVRVRSVDSTYNLSCGKQGLKKLPGCHPSRTVKTVTTACMCHFNFQVHLCRRSDEQGINGKRRWAAETLVQSPISVWQTPLLEVADIHMYRLSCISLYDRYIIHRFVLFAQL